MSENKAVGQSVEAPKTDINRADELKMLREQVAAMQQEKQKQMELSESLSKRIDELVEQRLAERENSYRNKIAEAQRMIKEAEENEAMERELLENEKYNKIKNWKDNKEKELKLAIDRLAEMGRRNMHMSDFYKDYDFIKANAIKGDERAKNKLGIMNLTYAAMEYGSERLVEMLKKNIGLV